MKLNPKNLRHAFHANNAGVALMCNGLFSESLKAFRTAIQMLENPKTNDNLVQMIRLPNITAFSSPTQQSFDVEPLEQDDLALLTHEHIRSKKSLYGIKVREIPCQTGAELDLSVAIVLYNYAVSCLVSALHSQQKTFPFRQRHIQVSKNLFLLAKNIALHYVSIHDTCQAALAVSALRITKFVFEGLFIVAQAERDESFLQLVEQERATYEAYINDALYVSQIAHASAARAASRCFGEPWIIDVRQRNPHFAISRGQTE